MCKNEVSLREMRKEKCLLGGRMKKEELDDILME